jgi:hypothetical protein
MHDLNELMISFCKFRYTYICTSYLCTSNCFASNGYTFVYTYVYIFRIGRVRQANNIKLTKHIKVILSKKTIYYLRLIKNNIRKI